MKVLPNMASVVDIKAVSYDVCGVVRMVSSGYRAKVKVEFCCSSVSYSLFSVFILTMLHVI